MSDQIPDAAVPQDEPVESAPTAVEEPAEAAGDSEAKPEGETQPKRPQGVEKRLNEYRREIGDAQRREDRYLSLLEQLAGKGLPSAPEVPSGPPRRENFSDVDEYLEARADYAVAEKLKGIEHQVAQRRQQESDQALEATWRDRQAAAQTKYEDYEEVTQAKDLKISPAMAEAIKTSDVGHEVAYFLGKNPAEAARIFALGSAAAQGRELGKIETRMSSGTAKPVSKASAPIDPISGGKSGVGDPAKMSMDEYAAWREKQGIARRR